MNRLERAFYPLAQVHGSISCRPFRRNKSAQCLQSPQIAVTFTYICAIKLCYNGATVLDTEDFQTEDISSYNHAKIIYRLAKILSRFDDKYDILPELEFDFPNGRAKPDIAIYNLGKINWLRDIIRPTQPPLIAIEILSPRQALSDLTDKWLDVYFPSGVATVWVIIPQFKQITVFSTSGQKNIYAGILDDEPTGISLDLAELFA